MATGKQKTNSIKVIFWHFFNEKVKTKTKRWNKTLKQNVKMDNIQNQDVKEEDCKNEENMKKLYFEKTEQMLEKVLVEAVENKRFLEQQKDDVMRFYKAAVALIALDGG